MIHKKHQQIEWLEFEQLQEFSNLKHALFLRHGGVSSEAFESLNMGGGSGDNPLHVEENRRRVMEFFPGGSLISPHQVHGVHLERVESSWSFQGGCDGLITTEKKKALMIKHADCQAALFYDPIKKILGQIHCGWRGNVQNIYAHTVDFLKAMGSNPSDLLVCISPSLGPQHSEFIDFQTEFPPSFQEFQWKECYFNLWDISRSQLKKAGILSSHIEVAEICTYAGKKDYFSYRRDKVTGRHGALAMLS